MVEVAKAGPLGETEIMKHDRTADLADGLRPDPFAPGVIRLRQAVRAQFRAVVGEVPAILRVEQGRKIVRGSVAGEVAVGGLALLPAAVPLDVENHPAEAGPYCATGLLVLPQIAAPRGVASALATEDARALAAFDRAVEMQRKAAVPQAIRDHAVLEVLLWLDAAGVRLPPPAPPQFADRVRALLAQDLARDWTAEDLSGELATSAATLRRRLAGEGTGFAALLTDLRMNRALGLLQTTDKPVGMIAQDVGYASPSRFALRFRARFGVSPGAIRQG